MLDSIYHMTLTHKAPPTFCSRGQFQILPLFQKKQISMIFHENLLLTDDSHEIYHPLFFSKIGKGFAKFVI